MRNLSATQRGCTNTSLPDVFLAAMCSQLNPDKPTVDLLSANAEGPHVVVRFVFTGLSNGIAETGFGTARFRQKVAQTPAGDELGRIVTTIPCGGAYAVIAGEIGITYGSGSRNAFVHGRAFLCSGEKEAVVLASELSRDCARSVLAETIEPVVDILMQLPPWDASRLLTETLGAIDRPDQREHLQMVFENATCGTAAGVFSV